MESKAKEKMREKATCIFELTKGFTTETNDNAMKAALEMAGYVLELTNDLDTPTKIEKDLAIEILARFTGNSRGTPIARNSFIDGANWAIKEIRKHGK